MYDNVYRDDFYEKNEILLSYDVLIEKFCNFTHNVD